MIKNILSWRDHCRTIISKVIEENKGKPHKQIITALKWAYPYGERRYHPYKIWLDEIKVQTGKKRKNIRGEKNNPNQLTIL